MQRQNIQRTHHWMGRVVRDIARQTQRVDAHMEGYCVSRAGHLRSVHSLDKDGVCLFCDKEMGEQTHGETKKSTG